MIFVFVSDFDIRISDFNHSGCFMQNKPNFRKARMNLNFYLTKDYENKPRLRTPPKQTQSNPIPQRDTQYAIRDTRYKPNQTQSCPPEFTPPFVWGGRIRKACWRVNFASISTGSAQAHQTYAEEQECCCGRFGNCNYKLEAV